MNALALIGVPTAVLATMTLGSLSKNPAWWIRDLDFPRLQLFVCGVAIVVAALALLDLSSPAAWLVVAVAAGCTLYQAWWIAPFTAIHRNEVRDADPGVPAERRLRFLVTNVLTPNRNADALLAMVREHRPQIVVAVETDAWWESRLDELLPTHPHALKCPRDNLYGMHLYSALPLKDAEIQFLVEDDVPSMHAMLVLPGGERVRLHCVHPAPPSPTENETSSERDAELVIVARAVADSDLPVIVLGDLNDVAWSRTTRLFRKISGLLDPRVGRTLCNTFHAEHWFMRWPLDHLFHSDHFTLVAMRRLPAYGSDHFPILVELALEAGAEFEQSGLDADADDQQEATETASAESVDAGDVHTPRA